MILEISRFVATARHNHNVSIKRLSWRLVRATARKIQGGARPGQALFASLAPVLRMCLLCNRHHMRSGASTRDGVRAIWFRVYMVFVAR